MSEPRSRPRRYQSSLDLSYETYAAIRHLPLARDVSQHARQQLVMRLDNHSERYPDLFQKVRMRASLDMLALDTCVWFCMAQHGTRVLAGQTGCTRVRQLGAVECRAWGCMTAAPQCVCTQCGTAAV